jgi:TolB protein
LTASGGSSAAANALVTPSQPAAAQGTTAVPWDSVGPGWVLAEYGTGTPGKPAPTTLGLVSPAGAKYALHRFPAQINLVAWSGDKTRALFEIGTTTTYQQWDLQTGKVISEFTLPKGTGLVSYTSPAGQQLIGAVNTFTKTTETSTVERFSLAGKVVEILASETSSATDPIPLVPAQSADGKTVALGVGGGLEVVSNAGGAVQKLPVPGTDQRFGCSVARWWDSGRVLAACSSRLQFRLWLVPTSGAKPTALTPVRTAASGDFGDLSAWQLSSGLYLQSAGPCGTVEVNKQAADGSITRVNIPGMSDSPRVVTATDSQLLVEEHLCSAGPGNALAWYNPGTQQELYLFTSGVQVVLPFPAEANR